MGKGKKTSAKPKSKVSKIKKIAKTGSKMRSGRLHLAKQRVVYNPNKRVTSSKKLKKIQAKLSKKKQIEEMKNGMDL
eukprot:CAMPEP_0117761946 /NCGR_PEP_ID=MMETSP0947-20121206/17594_1 /TAXON_ID=44440 /ORGANISM="Chattonella subsalsa, Strain CCMP2191" /LENGTH=76 /DNA_ID=CAMNT_0005583057 /DNA_START=79 /DNA_END=309 /DNA_ORIENTATION=+